MTKKIDFGMLAVTYIFCLYSSASFVINGIAKSIPPTDLNILITSISALLAVVISDWGAFYVDENETFVTIIKKQIIRKSPV